MSTAICWSTVPRPRLGLIARELRPGGVARRDDIDDLDNQFGAGMRVRELARLFVMPDLQDFNPPEEQDSPAHVVSREPAFKHIGRWLQQPGLRDNGNTCLFILGDAGMGKTSLLVMLKLRHLTARLPGGYDCLLLKLGRDTIEQLDAVEDPARTLLLLDSLDEDTEAQAAHEGVDARLEGLLVRMVRFRRAILTCRTQFFPESSPHFGKQHHFLVGTKYECALKYLALFDDRQVERYLRGKFRPTLARRFLGFWLGPR